MYGVFWESFSERGMHMWIKHEAVKILLDLAERRLLTSKLVLLMPTCWGTEHPQTRQRLHFTECRDDIQRTGGNFFCQSGPNPEDGDYILPADQDISLRPPHWTTSPAHVFTWGNKKGPSDVTADVSTCSSLK